MLISCFLPPPAESSSNHLIPTCGTPTNHTGFRISSNDTYFYTDTVAVTESVGIGRGCKDLNNCNNRGKCNYCHSKCECDDGFGSERDKFFAPAKDFNPDCSSRSCPVGISIGSLSAFVGIVKVNNFTVTNYTQMHGLTECANNGKCDRKTGVCKCNPGYFGASCQKMSCPAQCNNRGVCQSMKRLATNPFALPLSNLMSIYSQINYTITDRTWDADFGHMCVCDSSWPVGLGANETQASEYFGLACQYRHCPSGDDPGTRDVDETNCEGVFVNIYVWR